MRDMLTMLDAKQATFRIWVIFTGGSMQWRRFSTMICVHGSATTTIMCEYVESETVLSIWNDWPLNVAYQAVSGTKRYWAARLRVYRQVGGSGKEWDTC